MQFNWNWSPVSEMNLNPSSISGSSKIPLLTSKDQTENIVCTMDDVRKNISRNCMRIHGTSSLGFSYAYPCAYVLKLNTMYHKI